MYPRGAPGSRERDFSFMVKVLPAVRPRQLGQQTDAFKVVGKAINQFTHAFVKRVRS